MKISEIKESLDIIAVAAYLGIRVSPRSHKAHCPFHADKTPSLQFSSEKQIATCFSGSCDAGTMDLISLTEKKLKLNTHQALQWLQKEFNLNTVSDAPQKKQQTTETKPNTTDIKTSAVKTPYVETSAVRYDKLFQVFQRNLAKSEKAKAYLQSRHLPETAVGYNATGWQHLKHCIIYPLKNKTGEIVGLYGRSIKPQNFTSQQSKHYYTKDREGLYPCYPKDASTEAHAKGEGDIGTSPILVLTESIIDAVTINKHTNYQALALYGSNGLTAEIKQAIIAWIGSPPDPKGRELILFFDGDPAGLTANKKYSKELHALKPTIKISQVETPQAEDPNSLLASHDPEILTHLIENRTSIFPSKATSETHQPDQPGKLNTTNPNYLTYQKQHLKCTLLGGISLHQIDRLRVTLLLERTPKLSPLHSIRQSGLDLYNDTFVEKFTRTAAEKLETGTSSIRLLMAELIESLESYRLKQKESASTQSPKRRTLTAQRRKKALDYLKAPKLLARTNEDIGKSGVVGEKINRLLMYIVFTSRLRPMPLHIISLGASGTGKTYLQEKIAELMPEQDVMEITMLSENAFYYFKKNELSHKIILVEDMDGLAGNQTGNSPLLTLRELMSKKRINKKVVIKNASGKMNTEQLLVEGPICVAGTTTKEKIYEDNANRSILIYRDNSPAQQEKIMAYQRALSARTINRSGEESIKNLFKDMQILLKPIAIKNPYAEQLNIPSEVFKPLRSNAHYLQFIECITFYHQYQRPIKTDKITKEQYIETTLEDIEAANALLKDVLLAKADELSGACRNFFEKLKTYLSEENKVTFYSKEIRMQFRMNPHNLKYYINQLVRYNHLKITGGNRYKQGLEYEILNPQEYESLKNNIKNALDAALERIKQQKNKKSSG